MGARPLRRVIEEKIEDRIADYVLDHDQVNKLAAKLDGDGKIEVVAADTPVPTNTQTPSVTDAAKDDSDAE